MWRKIVSSGLITELCLIMSIAAVALVLELPGRTLQVIGAHQAIVQAETTSTASHATTLGGKKIFKSFLSNTDETAKTQFTNAGTDTDLDWGRLTGKSISVPSASPEPSPITLGDANRDFPAAQDYDGDRKVDIAVYRAGQGTAPSVFLIKQSSDGVVKTVELGQERFYAVPGDYDGDGKADPAVFGCPTTAGQPCSFLYRPSTQNGANIVTVPWGVASADPNGAPTVGVPGDYDGDGKQDFCVYQRNGGIWQFVLQRSSDSVTETISFGNFQTDYIVPGDFDGDGKSDFMVARTGATGATPLQWNLLTRTGGGTGATPIVFGITSDLPIHGDYDGDGKTDIAVHRVNFNTNTSTFFVLRSSDLGTLAFPFGQPGDFAPARWGIY